MRKVIMGVGTFLVVIGLVQLILSVALIGPVRAHVPEIDRIIDDAAVMLTDVADAADRGSDFLVDLDPDLAQIEGTIGDTITDTVVQLRDIEANLADAARGVEGGLDALLRFISSVDDVLAQVEGPLELMDDAVRVLDDLENNMAQVEGEVAATLQSITDYLNQLDGAMDEADGQVTLAIDDTLQYLRELGATLARLEETVTDVTDGVVTTRDQTVEMLENLVLEVTAEDLQQLIAPVDAILVDAEGIVADMSSSLEDAREATRDELKLIAADEVGIWSEDLIGWADWIEQTLAGWNIDIEIGYLRDWAAFIEPGRVVFPLELSPDHLDRLAELVENTELADQIRAEADWLRQQGYYLTITTDDVIAAFDEAIVPLEQVSTILLDASYWLTYWPNFLEREGMALTVFPVEMTAEDVDIWAAEAEAAGLDATWLRDQAEWLRQRGVVWSLTPQDFALAFDPVLDTLNEALDTIVGTSDFLGTLQVSLSDFRVLAVESIVDTRVFLGDSQTNIKEIQPLAIDGIADAREFLRTARASIAEARGPITEGLADSRASVQGVEGSVEYARDPIIDGIADTRALIGTAQTSLEDFRQPALGGIADTRGYLDIAQADIRAIGADLRVVSEDIVGLGIGGMIGDMIGWVQWFMILMSILFMAAGAGLFLLGMKKVEV